jgi:hypothetical protein
VLVHAYPVRVAAGRGQDKRKYTTTQKRPGSCRKDPTLPPRRHRGCWAHRLPHNIWFGTKHNTTFGMRVGQHDSHCVVESWCQVRSSNHHRLPLQAESAGLLQRLQQCVLVWVPLVSVQLMCMLCMNGVQCSSAPLLHTAGLVAQCRC